jgi:hypothetical protein
MMIDYVCTSCGAAVGRNKLTVKKSVFLEMGEGARTIRSRVVGWLCNACLQADPDYNLEKFAQKVSLNG